MFGKCCYLAIPTCCSLELAVGIDSDAIGLSDVGPCLTSFSALKSNYVVQRNELLGGRRNCPTFEGMRTRTMKVGVYAWLRTYFASSMIGCRTLLTQDRQGCIGFALPSGQHSSLLGELGAIVWPFLREKESDRHLVGDLIDRSVGCQVSFTPWLRV